MARWRSIVSPPIVVGRSASTFYQDTELARALMIFKMLLLITGPGFEFSIGEGCIVKMFLYLLWGGLVLWEIGSLEDESI